MSLRRQVIEAAKARYGEPVHLKQSYVGGSPGRGGRCWWQITVLGGPEKVPWRVKCGAHTLGELLAMITGEKPVDDKKTEILEEIKADAAEFDRVIALIAQGAINLDGNMPVEKGSPIHRAMHKLCELLDTGKVTAADLRRHTSDEYRTPQPNRIVLAPMEAASRVGWPDRKGGAA